MVVEEVHKTEVLLKEAVGEGDFWLRPPYGLIGCERSKLIKTPMIYWSVDPQDWKLLDKGKVVDAVLAAVQPGDIILLHDIHTESVDAAIKLIPKLQKAGYQLVTVSEMAAAKGLELEDGGKYTDFTK